MYIQIALMLAFSVCLSFTLISIDMIKNREYPRTVTIKKGSDVISGILMALVAIIALAMFIVTFK